MSDDLIRRKDVTEILFDEGWYGSTLDRIDRLPPTRPALTLAEALAVPEVAALVEAAQQALETITAGSEWESMALSRLLAALDQIKGVR